MFLSLPHAHTHAEIYTAYTTTIHGLSTQEAKDRLIRYGKNVLEEEQDSVFLLFLKQFKSPLIYVLLAAGLLSLLLKEYTDAGLIFGIVMINALLGFWQEYKAERALEALKKMTGHTVRVRRSGAVSVIPACDLVVGDVLIVQEGDVVGGDVRVVNQKGCLVDESLLTGESLPQVKNNDVLSEQTMPYDMTNMLFSGTTIVQGYAEGIVVRTGKESYMATIVTTGIGEKKESPVVEGIQVFARRYIFFLLFFLLVITGIGLYQGIEIFDMIRVAMAQLVSAVPEGLPIVLTLVLVIGALRLEKKHVLIRKLSSSATCGSVTVLLSDKTGTLTEGQLKVDEVSTQDVSLLLRAAALANEDSEGKADPIDRALSAWVKEQNNALLLPSLADRIMLFPFETNTRIMGAVYQEDKKEVLYVKGALESLLEHTAVGRAYWENRMNELAQKGLRVIAFGRSLGQWKKREEWSLEIIGLVGFIDPPKRRVREALEIARDAGIRVLMVTGDHPVTATAIACLLGYSAPVHAMTGNEFSLLSAFEKKEAIKTVDVFARVLPEQKYELVYLFQQQGHVVAVTGDGVNDVPALRKADIGIAMGNGSEAAKGVAQMVLVNNDLHVIVNGIREGRIISDNIKKVLYYLISTNVGALFFISAVVILGMELPFQPIHILWINLVTDGVLDKTFPFIKEEGNVMKRSPDSIQSGLFSFSMLLDLLYSAVLMAFLTLGMYFFLRTQQYQDSLVHTTLFTFFVMLQWINGLHAQQTKDPLLKNIKQTCTINPRIFVGIGLGIILQLIAISFLSPWFHAVPLSFELWVYIISALFLFFICIEIKKWLVLFYVSKK